MFGKKRQNTLNVNLHKKPEKKYYYAALVRINVNDTSPEIYQNTVKECFTLIQKHGGDINQFMGGMILALWGVPMCFISDKENSINFFNELQNSELPVSSVLLNDIGLYGSFGNEARLTVTAISDKIFNALKEITNCNNRIFINNIE